ncbi:hypothetical protein JZ751_027874 [Albula glossodonta]|uniref:Uncharacterized protein n=1 Tax=Albula glossodonta TaxID=121402 RepID=A0A8T2PE15_9TELE|nr:hypothetical protein JZ751_027874 [Albula glossodonta]
MALFLDGSQNVGAYYCLIRRRFKRRRKKRSERKGSSRFHHSRLPAVCCSRLSVNITCRPCNPEAVGCPRQSNDRRSLVVHKIEGDGEAQMREQTKDWKKDPKT